VPSILVTGASRGIGRAVTLRLARRGWHVVAGVRRAQDGEELVTAQPGTVSWLELDVTNPAHIGGLEERLPAELDGVVNNAGIVVGGPMETVTVEDLRRQLEVNLIGQVAVTQAVLPRLRRSRGRVIFVSSLSGRVATPLSGAYNASKFGLEGAADALRLELAPWGIRVVLIEPAQTDTDIWRNMDALLEESVAALSPQQRELYSGHIEGFRKSIPRSQRAAVPAEVVAAAVEKALTDSRPRARYLVGKGARMQSALARIMPTPALDAALRAGGGVPRRL